VKSKELKLSKLRRKEIKGPVGDRWTKNARGKNLMLQSRPPQNKTDGLTRLKSGLFA
jgi:hypothetical protein